MDDLFDIPTHLSPRLEWMSKHGLTTLKPDGVWWCVLDDETRASGETDEDACFNFCIQTGLKHWNQ